jgi:hypothetical protein
MSRAYPTVYVRRRHPVAGPFALCLLLGLYVAITISYWEWAVPALAIFIGLRIVRARMRRATA